MTKGPEVPLSIQRERQMKREKNDGVPNTLQKTFFNSSKSLHDELRKEIIKDVSSKFEP